MFLSFAGTYIVQGIFFGIFLDKENEGKGWERNISVRTLAWTSGQLYGHGRLSRLGCGPGAWEMMCGTWYVWALML